MKSKFAMCLLTFFCVMAGRLPAGEVYIENHSFEEPNIGKIIGWDMVDGAMHVTEDNEPIEPAEVPGWESDGIVHDSGVGSGGIDGDWIGFLMGDDPTVWQLTDHTIAAGEVFVLTFGAYNVYDGPEVTGNLYYDDNGTKVVVASVTVTGLVRDEEQPVPGTVSFKADDVPACVGKKIGIEFDNPIPDMNTAYGSWTGFDNVHLSVAIYHASLVYPADGAQNVPRDVVLEWGLEEGYTCDVYFGEDELHQVIADSLLTTYDPNGPEGLLDYDTTFYWQVDTIDPNDGFPFTQEGITWSFTSMSESVVIVSGPEGVTVPAGTDAVLTIEAASPSPINYKWYKVQKGTDELISDKTGDPDCIIEDVQLDDEGYYYCVLTNDVSSVESEEAHLMTARLVGWWKLNGDLTDSVATVVTGAPVHNGSGYADYEPGIDGDGLEFGGVTQVITIDNSEAYFDFYRQGMTVSAWVKSETLTWDGIIGKHFRPAKGDPVGWVVGLHGSKYGSQYGEYGAAHFTIRPYGDLFGNDYDGLINDDQWYLVTVVMDAVTQTNRIYINGAQKKESALYEFASIVMNDEPIVFGAEDKKGASPYTGLLDDVRIWNYPLSTADIAELYLEFVEGEDICVNEYEDWLELSFVGEDGETSFCKIDIEDLTAFITVWMECNLVPTCLP